MEHRPEYGPKIMNFWKMGLNTLQIAKMMWIDEGTVYNTLARIKDAQRRCLSADPPVVFRGVHVDRETA